MERLVTDLKINIFKHQTNYDLRNVEEIQNYSQKLGLNPLYFDLYLFNQSIGIFIGR